MGRKALSRLPTRHRGSQTYFPSNFLQSRILSVFIPRSLKLFRRRPRNFHRIGRSARTFVQICESPRDVDLAAGIAGEALRRALKFLCASCDSKLFRGRPHRKAPPKSKFGIFVLLSILKLIPLIIIKVSLASLSRCRMRGKRSREARSRPAKILFLFGFQTPVSRLLRLQTRGFHLKLVLFPQIVSRFSLLSICFV